MKKILGISLVAVLAVSPLMARAEGTNPTAATTTSEPYLGKAITEADRAATASAAYVKGAYNDAIGAVNAISGQINTNKADKDLGNVADGQVAERLIGSGAVTETKIGAGAVTEAKIGTGAVTADKIGANAVTTAKIMDANVTADKLATDSVTTVKIVDGNVTTAKLADGAVTTAKIANGNVTAEKLSSELQATLGAGATKEGVSASIDNATATGNVAATVSGTVGGTLTSDTSALRIGGGTITNTVTPTSGSVNIPNAWAGTANVMLEWGDTTAQTLPVAVSSTGSSSESVLTGVSVSSTLADATVTSGAISNTLTGLTVSGSATQNNVSFDVQSAGYFDNATDASPEYVPTGA